MSLSAGTPFRLCEAMSFFMFQLSGFWLLLTLPVVIEGVTIGVLIIATGFFFESLAFLELGSTEPQ